MPLVQFFGIGAPRSGTSWMARCLDEHPGLAIPVKEAHFFSRDGAYAAGVDAYDAQLRARWDGAGMVGEFCPNYLAYPASAARIHAYNSDARLVAILRDPIERAFSHFLYEVRSGKVAIAEGILANLERREEYLLHGYYHAGLTRYLDVGFEREQLLVLFYEDVRARPLEAYRAILTHLGADASFVPPSLGSIVNETRVPRSSAVERGYDVIDRALSSTRTLALRRTLAASGLPAAVRKLNAERRVPSCTPRERAALRERFAADVSALARFVGRPPPWPDF